MILILKIQSLNVIALALFSNRTLEKSLSIFFKQTVLVRMQMLIKIIKISISKNGKYHEEN